MDKVTIMWLAGFILLPIVALILIIMRLKRVSWLEQCSATDEVMLLSADKHWSMKVAGDITTTEWYYTITYNYTANGECRTYTETFRCIKTTKYEKGEYLGIHYNPKAPEQFYLDLTESNKKAEYFLSMLAVIISFCVCVYQLLKARL